MDAESLSLEETNKVRVSLGLAPLVDDAGTSADPDSNNQNDANEDDEDPDTIAETNWQTKRNEERRLKEEKETKDRLAKARNQRELRAKLEGKGLGDTTGEDDTGKASDWIKKSRKAAKLRTAELEKLKQREKELEERDRDAVYNENDLSGLKVGHGLDDFEEGQDVVLTLKDNKVLEEDDDELQNVNLAEYARTAERLDIKKRGKSAYKYTGFDDDEFDAFNQGKDRGVLSKYDEVIGESSKSGEGFRLGDNASGSAAAGPSGSSSTSTAARRLAAEREEKEKQLRRDLLSLDYEKTEQTDYLQEGDVGFKKPKKKKKRSDKASSSRRMATLDGDEDTQQQADTASASHANGDAHMSAEGDDNGEEEDQKPKIPTAQRRLAKEGGSGAEDGGVIDDDDMQAALARQRRAANKKRLKILKGEDLARQIMEEQHQQQHRNGSAMPVDQRGLGGADTPEVKKEEDDIEERQQQQDDDDDAEGGIVLDDTSEFIRNISARPVIAKREHAVASSSRLRNEAGSATPDTHVNGISSTSRLPRVKSEPRDDSDVPLDEMDVKEENVEEGDAIMDEDVYDHHTEDVKPDVTGEKVKSEGEDGGWQTTKTEKHHTSGLANTLAMLKTTGDVKPLTAQEKERERAFKERERFKNEIAKAEMEAELERAKNRATGSNKDQAQREYENKQRAYNQAQRQMEAFKNYKPNVEISYTDEFGRDLTPKEAWKDLSHKFHGKGSGTNKREKLLKKIEDERKRIAMSSGDTPMGTNAAFQARQERTGSATMVLGVGNRNAAPSADALLGSSAGRADLNVAKNKIGQNSNANKRKRTEPKILG